MFLCVQQRISLHYKVGGSLNKKHNRGFVYTNINNQDTSKCISTSNSFARWVTEYGENCRSDLTGDPSYWRLSGDEPCRLVDTPPPLWRLTGPWASMLKHTEVCVWGGGAELKKKKEPLPLCMGAHVRGPMQAIVPQNQTRTCFMKISVIRRVYLLVIIGQGLTIKDSLLGYLNPCMQFRLRPLEGSVSLWNNQNYLWCSADDSTSPFLQLKSSKLSRRFSRAQYMLINT